MNQKQIVLFCDFSVHGCVRVCAMQKCAEMFVYPKKKIRDKRTGITKAMGSVVVKNQLCHRRYPFVFVAKNGKNTELKNLLIRISEW